MFCFIFRLTLEQLYNNTKCSFVWTVHQSEILKAVAIYYSGRWRRCGKMAVVERLELDWIHETSAGTKKSGHCIEVVVPGGSTLITFFPFPYCCWITKDIRLCVLNFQDKYTRQKKLYSAPWRISLCKVNPRNTWQGTFPILSYFVTQAASAVTALEIFRPWLWKQTSVKLWKV